MVAYGMERVNDVGLIFIYMYIYIKVSGTFAYLMVEKSNNQIRMAEYQSVRLRIYSFFTSVGRPIT
jgi:hypothetical protein